MFLELIDCVLLFSLFRNKIIEVILYLVKFNDCIIVFIIVFLLFWNFFDEIKYSGNLFWCSIILCFIVGK